MQLTPHCFICDNAAWVAERKIARRHTTFAVEHYRDAICKAVGELEQYRQVESTRIHRMMHRQLTQTEGESYLLRAYTDLQILSPRTIFAALSEWRNPSHTYDGKSNSVWQLFNAVTLTLQPRARSNPQAHAAATIRLGGLLEDSLVPKVAMHETMSDSADA